MESNFFTKLKSNKRYLAIALIALVLIIVIIVIAANRPSSQPATSESTSSITGSSNVTTSASGVTVEEISNDKNGAVNIKTQDYTDSSVTIDNFGTIVSKVLSSPASTTAAEYIGDSILQYLAPASPTEYTAYAPGRTVQLENLSPYRYLYFFLDVSDDFVFDVRFLIIPNLYYGLYVSPYPSDPDVAPDFYIVFLQNEAAGKYDRDIAIDNLTSQIKQLTGTEIISVTTRDAYADSQ